METRTRFGRRLATCSQCTLLAISLTGLIYQFGFRPTFPDESNGFGMAVQLLPNVILLLALVFRVSMASWIGFVAASIALSWGLPDVTDHVFAPQLAVPILVLWVVTSVALAVDVYNDQETTGRVTSFLTNNMLTIAMLTFLFAILAVPIAAISLGLCSLGPEADYIGEAPVTDFDSRRAWGEKELSEYLWAIDKFAENAKAIHDDIGQVLKVAPIGSPNRTRSGWGDEFPASMNLEVIGENGSGILNLPSVYICGPQQLRLDEDAAWTCNGVTHLINASGDSYLSHLGVNQLYDSILEHANDDRRYAEVVLRCEGLDQALEMCGEPPRQMISPKLKSVPATNPDPNSNAKHYRMIALTSWTRQPLTFSEFHPHYRIPMLKIYAKALAQSDRIKDAVKAWQDAAEFEIEMAEALSNVNDIHRDLAKINDRLHSANESLKSAFQINPKNKQTQSLARERAVLSYLQSIDTSPRSRRYSHKDQPQFDAWADKCLGLFYHVAIRDAMQFPFLDRTVGTRRVRIARGILYINRHNVYEANITLEVAGRLVRGELRGQLREQDEQHVPVDLFADVPRPPDFPLLVPPYRWTIEQDKTNASNEIRLNAKTGGIVPKRQKQKKSRTAAGNKAHKKTPQDNLEALVNFRK